MGTARLGVFADHALNSRSIRAPVLAWGAFTTPHYCQCCL